MHDVITPDGIKKARPAIVLAGAHLWRQDSFESLCPRPLLPVANTTLIAYVLEWLRDAGITHVTICANDAAAVLRSRIGDGRAHGLDVHYYEDRIPRGPAGCCRDAAALTTAEEYIVVDGSIIPNVDLRALLWSHEMSRAAATVVVSSRPPVADTVDTDLSPTGIYILARHVLEQVSPTGYHDIKEMLIPHLHRSGEPVLAHPEKRPSPRVYGLGSYLAVQEWMLATLSQADGTPEDYEWRGQACVHRGAQVAAGARLIGPVMVGPGTRLEPESIITGPSVLGSGCSVGHQSVVARSVIWDNCRIGTNTTVNQCLVASGAVLGSDATRYGVICRADGAA